MSAHKYVKIKKRWIVFMNFNGWHGGALCQENEWHKLQQSVNSYNFCNSFHTSWSCLCAARQVVVAHIVSLFPQH